MGAGGKHSPSVEATVGVAVGGQTSNFLKKLEIPGDSGAITVVLLPHLK